MEAGQLGGLGNRDGVGNRLGGGLALGDADEVEYRDGKHGIHPRSLSARHAL